MSGRMRISLRFHRSALWAPVLIALAALFVGACSSDKEPATSPTSVPTNTPEPVAFQPITAGLEENPLAFFAAIPAFERNCLVTTVGQVRFDEITNGDLDLTDEEAEGLLACVSGITFGRVLAGGLINETDLESLSTETLNCMESKFSVVTPSDFVDNFEELAGNENPVGAAFESGGEALDVILPAFFCLGADERGVLDSQIAAEMGEDLGGFAPTIAQMECLFGSVGDDGLSGLFSGTGDAPPLEMLSAFSECGFDLGALGGILPIPTFEMPDLNLPDLSDLSSLELPGGMVLTTEQIVCLQESGVLEQIVSGEIGLGILGAVAECEVELLGLPSDGLSGLFGG
jgi:hypothetical protein